MAHACDVFRDCGFCGIQALPRRTIESRVQGCASVVIGEARRHIGAWAVGRIGLCNLCGVVAALEKRCRDASPSAAHVCRGVHALTHASLHLGGAAQGPGGVPGAAIVAGAVAEPDYLQ